MRARGMNEGEASQPHDETSLGHPTGAEGGKRRHVASRRMQEYLQQQGQTVPQKKHQCPSSGCQRVFSSAPGLRYHLQTVHASIALKFTCTHCQKVFKSHNGLKYHRQRTKCQETEADRPQLPHLSIPTLHTELRDVWGPTEQSVPSPIREGFSQDEQVTEPHHRKRRNALLPKPVLPPPLRPAQASAEDERLLEFANIATGPQSPLLRSGASYDWDRVKPPVSSASESKGDTSTEPVPMEEQSEPTDLSVTGREKLLSSSPHPHVSAPVTTTTTATSLLGLERETCTSSAESSTPEQYSAAVAALSNMAKLKKREASKTQPAAEASSTSQQKAKRPMNAFILWSQKRRQDYRARYPKTNNRDISVMLSKEWQAMDKSERQRLAEEAKRQADVQKLQHPDCWKRKK